MNDAFQYRVRSAAVAGWWMLLIAVGFLTLQWIVYLLVMSARPTWLLSLWGADISWHTVRNIWFWGLAFFKFCLWFLALGILWLTLWSRQMQKRTEKK
jgi:hypothetical protein